MASVLWNAYEVIFIGYLAKARTITGAYYLFPNLKRWVCGKRFESNEKVGCDTEGYFECLRTMRIFKHLILLWLQKFCFCVTIILSSALFLVSQV